MQFISNSPKPPTNVRSQIEQTPVDEDSEDERANLGSDSSKTKKKKSRKSKAKRFSRPPKKQLKQKSDEIDDNIILNPRINQPISPIQYQCPLDSEYGKTNLFNQNPLPFYQRLPNSYHSERPLFFINPGYQMNSQYLNANLYSSLPSGQSNMPYAIRMMYPNVNPNLSVIKPAEEPQNQINQNKMKLIKSRTLRDPRQQAYIGPLV